QVPKAAVGSYYTHQFRGEGGCGPALPYQFRILSGGLPPGLTLAPDGFVSGVPTHGGNFSFWLELSDQDPPSASWCVPKKSERLFTIDVGPRGSVPGVQVGPQVPASPSGGAGSGGSVSGGGESNPAFWDIPGQIKKAIDDWFRHLVTDALNPALELVGKTLLSTPQVVDSGRVGQLWAYSLGIADALLVLLIVIAGGLVMGHETVQSRYALKDALPRLAFAAIVANASLALSGQLIAIALPQTEGLARLWWRGMTAALGVQVAQAFLLATAVRVFFTSEGHSALGLSVTGSLIDLLVALCLLWLLVKVPFWAKELAF